MVAAKSSLRRAMGRGQPAGLTEGPSAQRSCSPPLHHSLRERSPSPSLRELVGELAADYRERGRDVAAGTLADAAVRARPMLLKRAIRNLVDNAVSYGARARLSVTVEGGEARIIVSDDGPGLTGEQIRTLIEPFARGEQSRNRATGGAGLGLSIAREIAEDEGGTLTLVNRAGGGLDAVIALPVQG